MAEGIETLAPYLNKELRQTNPDFQNLVEKFTYPEQRTVDKGDAEYKRLMQEGLPPTVFAGTDATLHEMSYIPGMSNAGGAVLASNDARDLYYNRGADQRIYIDKARYDDPTQRNRTLAHESEHLMATTGLGHPSLIGKTFEKIAGTGSSNKFIKNASNNLEYLQNKYNINPTYFKKNLVDSILSSKGGNAAVPFLSEQFATLSAIEQTEGVDLTEDPVLKNNLFSDPEVRQAYRALTGLRQTRLDSKDLDPYRPVNEFTKEYADRGLSGYYDFFMKKVSNQLDRIMGRR
jgi:hypothetical protein